MTKKLYKVIGSMLDVPLGSIIEADEESVVSQGLLGALFEEAPEGSKITHGPGAVEADEEASDAASKKAAEDDAAAKKAAEDDAAAKNPAGAKPAVKP